ncbi:unnamed protein product [Symbiodinium microadriaticum]|nr:unnamed protein product [Symbiodinium sp. KB8]CAE7523114.1 unnamed protein product [Symbiodinium microadriaticum]
MAWGNRILPRVITMGDVITMTSTIEKEERVMVKAYEQEREAHRQAKRRQQKKLLREEQDQRRRRHRDRGAALLEEGASAASSARLSASSSSPSLSGTSSSNKDRERAVPEDLKGLSNFPLVEDLLIKIRVHEDRDGRVPKLRFVPRANPAHWVPGSRMYVDYKPEFYLE